MTDAKRRARCVRAPCRHERYMHEYERGGKYTLGPCRSEPRVGEKPLLAHLCGCTGVRFEAVRDRLGE